MGKIFGISDNPVSTISGALSRVELPKCPVITRPVAKKNDIGDKFVVKELLNKSNPFIKMRNGIGKLMPHFSKSNPKK